MTPRAEPLAQFEHVLGGAMIRALTGNAELQWSGKTLYNGIVPVTLAAAHQTDADETLQDQRALLDGAGLRFKFSDASLHAAHLPKDPIAGLIFELLEQLRCESLAPEGLTGLQANLRERFERWARDFVDSGLTETSLGILLLTISVTVWTRLTGHEIDESMADLMEGTRANIVPELGHDLAGIKHHRANQSLFIVHALAISHWVANAVNMAQAQAGTVAGKFKSSNGFGLRLHFQTDSPKPPPVAEIGENKTWQETGGRYRIFTTAYDQQAQAQDLIRAAVLSEFRSQLDREIAALGINIPKLARQLRKRLSIMRRDGWNFQQEEGLIDGRRLAHLVSNPFERDIFQHERNEPLMDCAVTLLFDCSGSMKAHAQTTSTLADILGRALTVAGVATEILGFTTASWTGGRAFKDWQKAGRPAAPGRLNEQLHLVFKSASTPWRKARSGMAALRRLELYREGIDGEAVDWACQRLLALSVKRRILVVISDGCPMDSATHQTNHDHYLDQHLKQTVMRHERAGSVAIRGLGVGLDLGCFYRHRLAIDLQDGLDEALFEQIVNLISR